MVSRTREREAALFSRMAQHDAAVFGIAGSLMQDAARKGSRQSWIVLIAAGTAVIRRRLRRDHDKSLRIEDCHTIGDGGHVPVDEGDQTSRCNRHLFARWRLPEDLPVQCSGLHVEPPVVIQKVRIGQPERLVIDEKFDDFAIGHVTDRLTSFCETVSFFSVDDRPRFIEPINERTVFIAGAALLWAPAHAEVPVAER